MRGFCDLHTHSHFSDGTASPAQIIGEAVKLGLTAVALTDHNTVAGLPEFLDAAKGKEILAIPGVEISTGFMDREVHIVGLFLDPKAFARVTDFLSVINTRKEESNRNLIHVLRQAGYDIDYNEIRQIHKGNVNRAVIASVLREKGYISEIKEAFRGILSKKNGFYVPPERIDSMEAISFLRSIGAVPVLAHPYLSLQDGEIAAFLQKAIPCGLAAMETRYSTYSPETTAAAIQKAKAYGLLESGGSDFHGENKPDIRLGTGGGDLSVPDDFVKLLAESRK